MVLALSFIVKTAFALTSTANNRIMESNASSSAVGKTNPEFDGIAPAVSHLTPDLPIEAENMHNIEELSRDLDQSQIGPIHFCFIVHGHKGHAQDLWFLHQSIRDKANEHQAFSHVGSSENCSVGANFNSAEKNQMTVDKETLPQKLKSKLPGKILKGNSLSDPQLKDSTTDSGLRDSGSLRNLAPSNESPENSIVLAKGTSFLVCNPKCNEGTTDDGVEKGGIRLADEITETIFHEVDKKRCLLGENGSSIESPVDVTISLIGNSLGGLYTRYAIARLAEMSETINGEGEKATKDFYLIANGKTLIRLHFNVFYTTATPHLGCADHTYIPIPRIFEKGMGHALGETGRDLFRLNGLLLEMATSPRFTEPLSR